MTNHRALKSTVAVTAAAMIVLAACGSGGDGGGGDAPEPAEGPVTLSIGANVTRPEAIAVWIEDYVIPEFEAQMEAEGRDVTVEHIDGGVDDHKTQLALDLSVGEGPDITSFDQFWTAEFAAGGLIEPLSVVVGDAADDWDGWDQIPDAVVGSLEYEEERYGIPRGTDGRVIFFRKDVFADAGLPEDWQPESWDEILDAARTIQTETDAIPMQLNGGVNMDEATTLQGFIPLLLGAGGDLYTEGEGWHGDTPELRAVLEFYDTVFSDDLADADMQLLTDGRDRSFEAFAAGELGMLIESDYLWRAVVSSDGLFPTDDRDADIGWALIPAETPGSGINGQDHVSASGGTGWVINPSTEFPLEAWELMSFMGSEEAQLDWVEREPRITGRDDVNAVGIADDPMQTFVAEEVLPLTWYRPGFEEYPQVSEAIYYMVESVVAGREDVDSAAEEFARTLEGIVGSENIAGG